MTGLAPRCVLIGASRSAALTKGGSDDEQHLCPVDIADRLNDLARKAGALTAAIQGMTSGDLDNEDIQAALQTLPGKSATSFGNYVTRFVPTTMPRSRRWRHEVRHQRPELD
jgi:hypothetical protein